MASLKGFDGPAERPRKILMLTNSDLGQATVFLATSHALLQTDPDGVQLHFASFPDLESQVKRVSANARCDHPNANSIIFHTIEGPSHKQGIEHWGDSRGIPRSADQVPDSFSEPLSFSATTQAIRDTVGVFVPYNGPELVQVVSSVMRIIREVGADLVVVDALMTASLTACYHLDVKFCCLSPNSIKGFAAPSQPALASLWKYPALFSGFQYPVPLHLIPINFYYLMYCAFVWARNQDRSQTQDYLKTHLGAVLRTPIDLFRNPRPDVKIFVGTQPELDYPLRIPQHVHPCGPILRPTSYSDENDPELMSWLGRGSTVYVNLGSIFRFKRDQAREFAQALRLVFEKLGSMREKANLQVLWKFRKERDTDTREVEHILGPYIKEDRVRIVKWIQAEPVAILQSGHVACAVHHGGANSYYEAVCSGIPQVVLPQWTDCYEYAQLVRMHGIGRIGNNRTKPLWTVAELSNEMLAVLHGEEAAIMKQKAMQLADLCAQRGGGAEMAAALLLRECREMGTMPYAAEEM